MKNLKQRVAAFASAAVVTFTIAATSAAALNPNGKQWHIPKSCSSTANETLTDSATIFSFKVTEILNGNQKSCNYKRIRIKAKGKSKSVAWLPGCGFDGNSDSCSVVSGRYGQTMTIKAYKGTYCEIVPAYDGKTTYSFYYFGNDPKLDAYATIESDWA
ncbi:MAG: hypothetical protein K6F71_07580 [Ruminococcus sp.]|uniref:hypothetical protein n=1 Tax=Ruminococcus sp. TaxID=41978 RepID=UPI0025D90CE4|nr:hypothetical protein [Ruminococcus sp.]MCR5540662.1 hypothetical protein [Ruminococcus sp.]